jgi:hypothetical protein
MLFLVTKYFLTAGVVVLVSEVARRSDRLGALIASLPLVTVLTLIWLHVETQSPAKVANHAWYTFWYVLPTLPMFILFPWLMTKTAFWPSLLVSAVFTVGCFAAFALAMRRFGIDLL